MKSFTCNWLIKSCRSLSKSSLIRSASPKILNLPFIRPSSKKLATPLPFFRPPSKKLATAFRSVSKDSDEHNTNKSLVYTTNRIKLSLPFWSYKLSRKVDPQFPYALQDRSMGINSTSYVRQLICNKGFFIDVVQGKSSERCLTVGSVTVGLIGKYVPMAHVEPLSLCSGKCSFSRSTFSFKEPMNLSTSAVVVELFFLLALKSVKDAISLSAAESTGTTITATAIASDVASPGSD